MRAARLVLAVALLALGACRAVGGWVGADPPGVTRSSDGPVTTFAVDRGPGVAIGSSEDITAFEPAATCRRQAVTNPRPVAIACNTPGTVRVTTAGQLTVRYLEAAPVPPN